MVIKLISLGKHVVIDATNGTETLASANDVFNYIDPAFKNLGGEQSEKETPEMTVDVYEQIKDATYPEIFGSVDQNLNHLVVHLIVYNMNLTLLN